MVSIYNWCFYLFSYFFLAKESGNRRNQKKNKKNQSGNFEEDERFDNDRGNS